MEMHARKQILVKQVSALAQTLLFVLLRISVMLQECVIQLLVSVPTPQFLMPKNKGVMMGMHAPKEMFVYKVCAKATLLFVLHRTNVTLLALVLLESVPTLKHPTEVLAQEALAKTASVTSTVFLWINVM